MKASFHPNAERSTRLNVSRPFAKALLAAAAFQALSATYSHAVVVANYTAGTNPPLVTSFSSFDSDPGSTASDIQAAAGFQGGFTATDTGNAGDPLPGFLINASVTPPALLASSDDYVFFTLQSNSGPLAFNGASNLSLSFGARGGTAGVFVTNLALFVAKDGGAFSQLALSPNTDAMGQPQFETGLASLASLNGANSVEFRLFVYDNAESTFNRTALDNIVVDNGFAPGVPVPEPTTALFGCALIGALAASRKRREGSVSAAE